MKKILIIFMLAILALPAFANAESLAAECNSAVSQNSAQTTGTKTETSKNSPSGVLENPITGVPSVACLFYKIVDFIMGLSYVVIAIFLLLAGFKFVTAQGSTDKLSEAKKTFWYTIIGALILIGARTLIEIVIGILTQIKG